MARIARPPYQPVRNELRSSQNDMGSHQEPSLILCHLTWGAVVLRWGHSVHGERNRWKSEAQRRADSRRVSSAQHRSPTKHRSGVKATKVNGVKRTKGRIFERSASNCLARFGPTAIGTCQAEGQQAPIGANAYERSAEAAHKRSRNSTRPRSAGIHRAADSSWPAGLPDDRINDRPPGIFHLGREPLGAWAADGPHRQTALSTWGRFCCARPRHGMRDQP